MKLKEINEVGELIDTEDGGLAIKLLFGKALKRVLQPFRGKRLQVSFQLLEYQRSKAQNAWLWGVAYVTISAWYKETHGYRIDKDVLHAHTLQEILERKIVVQEVFGKEVISVQGKSTSNLTIKEFNELKEKLQAYWAERGCYIPDPKGNNMLSDFIEDT